MREDVEGVTWLLRPNVELSQTVVTSLLRLVLLRITGRKTGPTPSVACGQGGGPDFPTGKIRRAQT